ncbi:hypothetical protein D8B45_00350 [Candidatus Gracilibacteria bacterium]|nr:MAG: hypothetical protein D8B45_02460 [Candidatus Gracilibacteria bacterium]RKW25498.1 MAG: hypothetical protein D8B45_00350 [Candidatus Gracilibacteria bacterium]
MQSGKLIVLYGINNLGKTTQAHLLIDRLRAKGLQAEYLKYPIYDLAPSGPLLNAYLREGNPNQLSSSEFQLLQVINRTQYDSTLKNKLENGIWIIAEDYTGTGIARGTGAGGDQAFLEKINSHLHKEDLAFFFDGERFSSGIEKVHQHEQNNELMNKVRLIHQNLAQKLSREPINANLSIEEIQSQLQKIISEKYL